MVLHTTAGDGQYCIFYMSIRARSYSTDYIVHVLNSQVDDSDRFVTCFIKLFMV